MSAGSVRVKTTRLISNNQRRRRHTARSGTQATSATRYLPTTARLTTTWSKGCKQHQYATVVIPSAENSFSQRAATMNVVWHHIYFSSPSSLSQCVCVSRYRINATLWHVRGWLTCVFACRPNQGVLSETCCSKDRRWLYSAVPTVS